MEIFDFLPMKLEFLPYETVGTSEEVVLFLKKVHSWGGVTEMVHGSVLLVL